jgi:hypothetical protein
MSSNKPKSISVASPGFIRDVIVRIRLILSLMGDRRVSPFVKVIPIAALAYAIWPFDIPLPFDDAAVLLLASYLFVELCPPGVVQEHLDRIKKGPNVNWDKVNSSREDVVDGEFREVDRS